MISENNNDISFFYPLQLIIEELNMQSSYLVGDTPEKLKIVEISEEHSEMVTDILKYIVPIIYGLFVDYSVSVKNGMIVNHDGVTIKIDRPLGNGTPSYNANRLIQIDGLLKGWIIKHALAEWIQSVLGDMNLYQALIKDDEKTIASLTESIQITNTAFEGKSYTVSIIS